MKKERRKEEERQRDRGKQSGGEAETHREKLSRARFQAFLSPSCASRLQVL